MLKDSRKVSVLQNGFMYNNTSILNRLTTEIYSYFNANAIKISSSMCRDIIIIKELPGYILIISCVQWSSGIALDLWCEGHWFKSTTGIILFASSQ